MNQGFKVENTLIKNKWIILIVLLAFMALSAETIEYLIELEGVSLTFFEIVLQQVNEPHIVLFPFVYILLLFTSERDFKTSNKKMPFEQFKNAFLYSALYIVFLIAANLLFCLVFLNTSVVFSNTWSYMGDLSNTHLSPLVATAISLILLFLRFVFMLYLISFINTLVRKSFWGFWGAFVISYIDFMLYEVLFIQYPLGILPLEHTRILYTSALVPDFDNVAVRIPYSLSGMYWIVLITIVYFAFVLVYKKRRNNDEYIY